MKRFLTIALLVGTLICFHNNGASKIRAVVTVSSKGASHSLDTVIAIEGNNVYDYKVDDAFNFKEKQTNEKKDVEVIGKQALGRLGWKIVDDHHFIYYNYSDADFPQHYYYNDNVVVLLQRNGKDTVAFIHDSSIVRDDTIAVNGPIRRVITTWQWRGDLIRTFSILIDSLGKRMPQKGDLVLCTNGISARTTAAILATGSRYGNGRRDPSSQDVYFRRMQKKSVEKIFWRAL